MNQITILICICLVLTIWNIWLTFAMQALNHYQNHMEQELNTSIGLTDLAVSVIVKDQYPDSEEFYHKMDKLMKD